MGMRMTNVHEDAPRLPPVDG